MSTHGPLGDWYRSHLGEPIEADHVDGYWAFLLGAFLALLGLLFFLVASTFERGADDFWLLRRVAFTLALVAGPVLVLSVVYLLPLQERAETIALVGLLLCVAATVAFNVFYPDSWNWGTADRSGAIMAGYGLGVGIQIATVFAYPLVTEDTAQPAAVAERSEASFQLYEDRAGKHRWRLVHDNGNVVADGGQGYASRQKARQGMESVKRNAAGATTETLDSPPSDATAAETAAGAAGARPSDAADGAEDDAEAGDEAAAEPTPAAATPGAAPETDVADDGESTDDGETDAADDDGSTERAADDETAAEDEPGGSDAEESAFEFGAVEERGPSATVEVYEDRAGKFRWRLRHTNGNVVADSGQGYTSRSRLDQAVERLQTVADEADTLEYDPAAFELYADDAGDWRWRLRHENGRILADAGGGYASRRNARNAIESVRTRATEDDAFEVFEDAGGEYRWRLAASNGDVVADGRQGYTRESGAQEAVERIAEYAPDADTLDYDPAAFELYEDSAGKWRWRLRHRNGNVLADSGQGYASKQKAKQGMRSVMSNAPGAEVAQVGE